MATTKVSALSAKTSIAGSEELLINDGGTSKKVTATNLLAGATDATKLPLAGGQMTGNITMAGSQTVDGRDLSVDGTKLDGIEANATADQSNAEIKTAYEANSDTNAFTDADHSKLDGIEASADVTDATNVTAAGALMDSEVTNLAQVKAFDSSDYATAAQGTTADNALPKAGGTMTGNIVSGDNVKATYGASADLEIYHDGNDSKIVDKGTGNMLLLTNGNFYVQNEAGSETIIRADVDGSVDLYYDNSKKFETTANGVTITGTGIATTNTDTTNTGSVTLDFGANQNFVLTLTGNVTLANPSTEQVGQSGFITFIQDGTGSRTVSLGTDYETAGGSGLTLTSTASATDIVPYVVVASGRILLGTPQLAFA